MAPAPHKPAHRRQPQTVELAHRALAHRHVAPAGEHAGRQSVARTGSVYNLLVLVHFSTQIHHGNNV